MTDGVNLAAGRRALAGLTREQLAAHERMATLPRTVHVRTERNWSAIQAAKTEILNRQHRDRGGVRGASISLTGSRPAKPGEKKA
jgi:hypothetical protein